MADAATPRQIGVAYDFEGRHVGLVASGPGAEEALTAFASSLDARLLTVRREEGALWAWLGSKRRFDPGEIEELASREPPAGLTLAIGEPGEGISGWRLTHRQARAAHSVALCGGEPVVLDVSSTAMSSSRPSPPQTRESRPPNSPRWPGTDTLPAESIALTHDDDQQGCRIC